ncbi:glycine-rich protein DOT1-like [Oryza glaberrima]|uniref:glycine-rich protein DOT1-like n=1 Tax=Oryza glaberrima TaxID=4538 RepID=UPI00224C1E4B|nr:glycine-rich protein DOT1-like [Oryza glaberrima]
MSAITSWSAASDAGVLGANCVEEGLQHGGGEHRHGRGGSGGGGKDEATQRLEGGDERVVRRGVVGYGARVAEAAAHDGQHGAGLGGYRAGEAGIPRGGGGGRIEESGRGGGQRWKPAV